MALVTTRGTRLNKRRSCRLPIVIALTLFVVFILQRACLLSEFASKSKPRTEELPETFRAIVMDVSTNAASYQKVADIGTNVKIPSREIYVLSAIYRGDVPTAASSVSASTRGHPPTSRVVLAAWKDSGVSDTERFVCCLPLNTSRYRRFLSVVRVIQIQAVQTNSIETKDSPMRYVEYSCAVTSSHVTRLVHFGNDSCQREVSLGLEIEFPQNGGRVNTETVLNNNGSMVVKQASETDLRTRQSHTELGPSPVHLSSEGETVRDQEITLAICVPVLYGRVTPAELVEWLEFQRLVGVSRVHVAFDNLDKRDLAVLRHYRRKGLVTLRPFSSATRPGERPVSFKDRLGTWRHLADLLVSLNDCRHRLSAFTYVTVLDVDELFVPQEPFNALTDVVRSLMSSNPDAAYFYADSFMHVREWGPSNRDSSLFFLQHLDRTTDNKMDTIGTVDHSSPKTIFRSGRVRGISLHRHLVQEPFKKYSITNKQFLTSSCRYPIPSSQALLHHYRSCKVHKFGDKCWTWDRTPASDLLRFKTNWEEAVSVAMEELSLQ